MVHSGVEVLPLMSFNAAGLDTRFGTAESWKKKVEAVTGRKPIETLQGAEPLGPQNMADAMVIAPCTGATLAKLAAGISDTPVTLGAKSMLRGAKPLVLAVSTNDGLAASMENLAPVSYTHLDVYKRQDVSIAALPPFGAEKNGLAPVFSQGRSRSNAPRYHPVFCSLSKHSNSR